MSKAGRQVLKHISLSQIKKRCKTHVKSSSFYGLLKVIGFEYGESLTVIGDCLKSEDEYVAEMNLPPSISSCINSHSLHPSILDGALQTVALCYTNIQENELQKRPIPVRIASLKVYKPMEPKMHIIGKRMQSTSSGISLNLFIVNEDGEIVLEIKGYEIKNIAHGVTQENIQDKLYKIIWKPIENSHGQSNEIKKIFSITFTNDAKQIIENIFKDENHYIVSLPFDYERITIQELLQVLFKYLETKFERAENISHILFFPGLSCRSIDQSTDEIFTAVKASCVVLSHLIQHLVKQRMGEIPTFIITKQTQMKVNIEDESWVNVIGSELWGMVRCTLRERILSNLRLIDFDKETDLFLLKEIVFKSESGELKNNPEFKIQGQRLYKNQICKFLVEEPVYRKNTYNVRETVDLKSNHHESLENLLFVPAKENISNHHMPPNHVKMRVTAAFISDTWTPKTSPQAAADLNPWLFQSKDGYQIISSETTGHLEQDTILYTESATCFNSSKIGAKICSKHAEYVTCFPCAASNCITVPEKCLLEKNLFPTYIPGMLLETVMYFALVAHIKENTPLVAFLDQDISLNGHLLECIFQYFKRKLMLHRNVESIKTTVASGRYQIILLTTNLHEIEEICNQLESIGVHAYFFSSLMSKSLERNIRHQFPNLSLTQINCDQVLSQETLANSLPKIKKWLLTRQIKNTLGQIELPTCKNGHILSFKKIPQNTNEIIAETIPVARFQGQLFSKHALYIIIGGLTGLGWEILKGIAAIGGGVLVSISRRQPNELQRQNIDVVKNKYSCNIETIQADISVFSSISNAFTHIRNSFPEQDIKGIFHGAAVVDDALLPDMTEQKFDKVLRPKVLGTWNLHLLSKDLTLDYFILHSSITSAFGNAGQTNYGAGNAFKDSTAMFRRGIGLAGQTINWGALKLGLIDEKTEKHLESQGFPTMEKNEIIQCFLHSLFVDPEQIICGIVDWKTVMQVSPDMLHISSRIQPIIEDLHLQYLTRETGQNSSYIQVVDADDFQKLPTKERKIKVEKMLSQIAAEACAVDITMIKIDTRFASLGMDSMKGMAFINNVYKYVSCKIPVLAVLEEESTIASVAELILEQIQVETIKYQNPPTEKDAMKTNLTSEKVKNLKTELLKQNTKLQVDTNFENQTIIAVKIHILNGTIPKRLQCLTENGESMVHFTDITNFQMIDTKGKKVLQLDTNKERYELKSSDVGQMLEIFTQLENSFDIPKSTDL